MEYLEGRDLAEELLERQTLPVGVACGWIVETIDAVGHAHAVGIVHRDLKPANLFLARRPDGKQRIKVLDFGISKSFGAGSTSELSLTKTSAWIGSPLYMSPEQMQSARDVDHRADIWSLGAILYEMLSGRPPYVAESLPQLCNLLLTRDPDPISSLVPSLPADVARAVMGCLHRDVNQRIQTTAELSRILGRYATTVTGSGVNSSLLARTEVLAPATNMQASLVPGGISSMAPTSLGMGAMTGSQATSGTGSVGPSTAASWGGTNGTANGGGSKLAIILGAAALVVAGIGTAFVLSRPAPVVAGPTQIEPAAAPVVAPVATVVDSPKPAPEPSAAPAESSLPVSSAPSATAPPKAPPKAPKAVRPTATTSEDADFGGRR
jgi:eukaryotic-like serine/threonine-protein kinase